jgi:hypothetical protein
MDVGAAARCRVTAEGEGDPDWFLSNRGTADAGFVRRSVHRDYERLKGILEAS